MYSKSGNISINKNKCFRYSYNSAQWPDQKLNKNIFIYLCIYIYTIMKKFLKRVQEYMLLNISQFFLRKVFTLDFIRSFMVCFFFH